MNVLLFQRLNEFVAVFRADTIEMIDMCAVFFLSRQCEMLRRFQTFPVAAGNFSSLFIPAVDFLKKNEQSSGM